MDEAEKHKIFVFGVTAVCRSIDSLLKKKNHEHVPGYLALLRAQKTRVGTPSQISDIVEFHDRYLKVLDVDPSRPYLRPFVSRGKDIWFNENVSGSYAPSNAKAEPRPFFLVVDVSGSGLKTTYSLKADHATLAFKHLFKNNKLPIVALTAFIYRDYGLRLEEPSIGSAVSLFRNEFCLSANNTEESAVFDTLFYDDYADFTAADIEPLTDNADG